MGSYGLATSSGQGTATITATSGSISNSTTIAVGQASLSSIAVTPASISIALGYGEQFSATATYSDGSTQDRDAIGELDFIGGRRRAVNSSGYATSIFSGTTTVSASLSSFTAGAVLSVTSAVPISLVVTPSGAAVLPGAQQQFSATLNYSDGSSQNVTGIVSWSSLTPGVATISSSGLRRWESRPDPARLKRSGAATR